MYNFKKQGKLEYTRVKLARLVHKYANMSYLSIGFRYLIGGNFEVTLSNSVSLKKISLITLAQLTILHDRGWYVASAEADFILLSSEKGINITCRANKGNDIGHLFEIFIRKIYGEHFEGKNVIDVGMSNGDSSIYFALQGAKKVLGVEPYSKSFTLASNNIKNSGFQSRIVQINKAVSKSKGSLELSFFEDFPHLNTTDSSNMVTVNANKLSQRVEGIQLEDLIEMFGDEKVYLLKMDCEGCEYSVLLDLEKSLFEKIETIILEYHNGPQELPNVLKDNDFLVSIVNFSNLQGCIMAKRQSDE